MFLKKFVCGPLANNVYLFGFNSSFAVIDPSFNSAKLILKLLGINKLEYILLTHSHFDHIAEAKLLKDKTKAKLCVHELDAANVIKPGSDGLLANVEATSVDILLKDKQKIQVADIELVVIHTPGHTLGSVCFYIEKEKLLFSGDTLFKDGIGRVDLPTSNKDLMHSSLQKLSHLPGDTHVFPGHGPEIKRLDSQTDLFRLL